MDILLLNVKILIKLNTPILHLTPLQTLQIRSSSLSVSGNSLKNYVT